MLIIFRILSDPDLINSLASDPEVIDSILANPDVLDAVKNDPNLTSSLASNPSVIQVSSMGKLPKDYRVTIHNGKTSCCLIFGCSVILPGQ